MVTYKSDDGVDCRVKIWDTAGQERFRQLTNSFFKDADGVFVIFNLASQESFDNTKDWISNVKRYTTSDFPIVLVGNTVYQNEDDQNDTPTESVRTVDQESAR